MNSSNNSMLSNLNRQSAELCQQVQESADRLDVRIFNHDKIRLLDFGVDRIGTFEAGIMLARICMADLVTVNLRPPEQPGIGLWTVDIVTDWPLHACIAAQYAGWPFATEKYYAMCSGPARLRRGKEEILDEYSLCDPASEHLVAVLEADRLPDATELEQFAEQIPDAKKLSVCIAPTNSLPGTVQVVARSVETAMHKLYELGFNLNQVRRATGTAPCPPLGKTSYQSLGWTNDAVLYGGRVQLWLDTPISELEAIAPKLPSNASPDSGRPFCEIFEKNDRDFYKIDKLLFSPAQLTLHSLPDGKLVRTGSLRTDVMSDSFGLHRFDQR